MDRLTIKSIELDYCNFIIKTNEKYNIECELDSYNQCCETFGITLKIDGEDNEHEIGINDETYSTYNDCHCYYHHCNCEFCDKNGEIYHTCENSELMNYIDKEIVDIIFDRPKLTIIVKKMPSLIIEPYVNHNGYYPHDYTVSFPNIGNEYTSDKDRRNDYSEAVIELGKTPPDINEVIRKLGSL